MPTKGKRKRPGRPVTGRGTTGKRLEVRMTVDDRKAIDAHAKERETSPNQLAWDTLDEAGLFKMPGKVSK